MKTFTTALILLFSMALNAQSNKSYGFITERYDYNFKNSEWDKLKMINTDIEFVIHIFDSIGYNNLNITIINQYDICTQHTFTITDQNYNDSINTFELITIFSDKVTLMYNNMFFMIYFDYQYTNGKYRYTSYFRGTFRQL